MARAVGAATLALLVGWVAAASCPKGVKVLDTVDLNRYQGIWYEVASKNLQFLSGCTCSRYEYKMTGAQTYDDHFSCTRGGKPAGISVTLKGKIPDLAEPAVQKESPMFGWLPAAPYLILEVGAEYEHAVVYACVDLPFGNVVETIYVFARDPGALEKNSIDLEGIKRRLREQGIDGADKIALVPQPTNCSYPATDDVVKPFPCFT